MVDIKKLLQLAVEKRASDLHLKVGNSPILRISTELIPTDFSTLSPKDTQEIASGIMNDDQKKHFEQRHEVDFAYAIPGIGRFRVNVYQQRGSISIALRQVAAKPPLIEEINLPPVISKLAEQPRGLVLVTGTAGCGKTTTLAAMVNHINQTRKAHIITIEDPIEILHGDQKSIIDQRELGIDTFSYPDALKHVVRQDPDVVLIGEMRDNETVQAALSAAEIGNLVLSTLHTVDVSETVNRIIDFFPPHQQKIIRIMLAFTLKGIISQRLLSRFKGGLIPAVEVMVNTATTRDYILKPAETHKIKEAMEKGEYYGMQSFDQSLIRLYMDKEISLRDALAMSANEHDFKIKLKQLGIDVGKELEKEN